MAQQECKPRNKKFEKHDAQVEALKVPPHSVEAEQSVLGGLMLDNEAWDRVSELVVSEDFIVKITALFLNSWLT